MEALLATMNSSTRDRVLRLQARGPFEDRQTASIARLEEETDKRSFVLIFIGRRECTQISRFIVRACVCVVLSECHHEHAIGWLAGNKSVEESLNKYESKSDNAMAALKRDIVSIQKMVMEKLELFSQDWEKTKREVTEHNDRLIGDLRQELQESMMQLKQEVTEAMRAQQENHAALLQQVDKLGLQVLKLEQKTEYADSKSSNLFDGVDAQFVQHESSYKSMEDQLRKLQPRFTQQMKAVDEQILEILAKVEDLQQNKAMLETKVYSLEEFEVRCSNQHRELEDKLNKVQQQKVVVEETDELKKTRLEMGREKKMEPFRVAPSAVIHSRKL